ncbi:MAG TPA: response regulator transcription factor [Erysipelotrichaceae bacterium]|nr:response regulator transcription factor [Erysipelotrichaceae bacterium]
MKKVICVVEDEKDLNELVKRYLEQEGYEVRQYFTYESAYAAINDDDINLWILDIMLDDKSGFDLIDEIKIVSPEVPVIFMSARDQDFDRIIGLERGSDDYVTKPFSPKELVLRVNAVIRRTYRDTFSKRLSVDTYEVDESSRMVYQNDAEIVLTTKEFDLLLLFAKNPQKAFSREQILDQVWKEDSYLVSDRVIDDTLRKLRRKMPDLNISTIYGFGYRLG